MCKNNKCGKIFCKKCIEKFKGACSNRFSGQLQTKEPNRLVREFIIISNINVWIIYIVVKSNYLWMILISITKNNVNICTVHVNVMQS
jgi:hypothetical protein